MGIKVTNKINAVKTKSLQRMQRDIESQGVNVANRIVLLVPEEYSTIQAAIDAATNLQYISVAPGIYSENVDFKGKSLLVLGRQKAANTIISPSSGSCVSFTSGEGYSSRLHNLTLMGGTGTSNLPTGYACGGGVFISASSPRITNCILTANVVTEPPGHSGNGGVGAAIFSYGGQPTFEGCAIHSNSADEKGGALACGYSTVDMINCTIARNVSPMGSIYLSTQSYCNLKNCIIYAPDQPPSISNIYLRTGSSVEVHYSFVLGGISSIEGPLDHITWGSGNLDGNPGLDGFYHLLAGSQCIDAGNNSFCSLNKDIDKTLRVGNGVIDVGCHEFNS